jgi:sugar-specific transcriptional regulator TrmB
MGRITKEELEIYERYLEAKKSDKFDRYDPSIMTRDQLKQAIRDGKVFKEVLNEIEYRLMSTHSLISSSVLGYVSDEYKKNLRKGIKQLMR